MKSATTRRDAAVSCLDDSPLPSERLRRRGASLSVMAVGLVAAAGFGATSACGSPEYSRLTPSGSDGASNTGSGGGVGSGGAPQASGGVTGSGGAPASGGGAPASGGNGSGGAASGGAASSGGAPGTGGAASVDAGIGGAASGGRAATGGAGTGGAATGGRTATGGAGTGGAGTGGAGDTARYNFESNTQSWGMPAGTPMFTSVTRDTSRRFAGSASLAGAITATGAATYQLQVAPNPAPPAGAVVTAHIYVPSGSTVDWLQLFLQETVSPYTWTGTAVTFTAGMWNTLTVTAPTSGSPVGTLGVQVHLTGAWTGTVYVDSVTW